MNWIKSLVILLAILLAGFVIYTLYLRLGPYERLSEENQKLAEEVAEASRAVEEINTVKDDLSKKSRQVEDLQAQLDGLRTTITKMEVEKETLVTEAEQVRKALKESEAHLGELSQEIENIKGENSQKIQSLEDQLAQKDLRIANLQKEAKELDQTIATLEGNTRLLSQEKSELEGQLERAQVRLEEATRAMAAGGDKLEELRQAQQELVRQFEKQIREKDLEISTLEEELTIRFLDKILFEPGNAVITAQGKEALKNVAEELTKLSAMKIRVEGHTDNLPLSEEARAVYIDNLGLSIARAAAVARTLRTLGVGPELLSAAGYSMHKPVARNDTPEGREQNRRVEIILTPPR